MTSTPTLIISFGERKRLLSKPATYTNLLECARRFFSELQGLQDEEIVFYFKPEWFDEELELDESAFHQVHDNAQLRIETHKVLASNRLKRLVDMSEEPTSTLMEPAQKRIKMENPQQDPIDLTVSSTSTTSNLPAAAVNTSPGSGLVVGVGETVNPQQSQQDIGTALRDDHSEPMADSLFPLRARSDNPTAHDASVQSRAAVPAPSATAAQGQSLTKTELTSDHFPVDINSPTRLACPTRQILAGQGVSPDGLWVAPRTDNPEDWAGSDNPPFRVRLLTERHEIRLTVKSMHVHVATLLKHALELGYSGPIDQLQFRTAQGFKPTHHAFPLYRSRVDHDSDVYVFRDDCPGVHLFPRNPNGGSSSHTHLPERLRVTLKLNSELRLSSLYPWATVKKIGQEEEVTWEVSTSSRGDIISRVGEEKYYGGPYWELSPSLESASVPPPNKNTPSSPPPQPPSNLLARLLNPENSVVLSVKDALFQNPGDVARTGYLMKVLSEQLKLPNNIAREFTNRFLRDEYRPRLDADLEQRSIAITFVPQKLMEKIAPLQITPVPATTRRIFMLWGWVYTASSTGWWRAWYGVKINPPTAFRSIDWAQVVGPDLKGHGEESEFTALEWGMMKVPTRYLVKD